MPIAEITLVIRGLVDGLTSWEEVLAKYPAVARKDDEEEA